MQDLASPRAGSVWTDQGTHPRTGEGCDGEPMKPMLLCFLLKQKMLMDELIFSELKPQHCGLVTVLVLYDKWVWGCSLVTGSLKGSPSLGWGDRSMAVWRAVRGG